MYSISNCPIKFHDLLEIFEFLINVPTICLWQFDGLPIRFRSIDIMYIRVVYVSGYTYVSYQSVR
nr:hypothetical protein JLTIEETK_JLTIEETK_CDS_0004 [Microvirus sp.]